MRVLSATSSCRSPLNHKPHTLILGKRPRALPRPAVLPQHMPTPVTLSLLPAMSIILVCVLWEDQKRDAAIVHGRDGPECLHTKRTFRQEASNPIERNLRK